MEVRRQLLIRNSQGLHARPCHSIVSTALQFQCEVRFRSGGREVNGKSILELMTLCASEGAQLEVRAWGRDASLLVDSLTRLFEGGFGEMESASQG